MNDVFERIYRSICKSICTSHEVANKLQMKGDPYPRGKIVGLHEALFTAALYMGVDEDVIAELRAMEGF